MEKVGEKRKWKGRRVGPQTHSTLFFILGSEAHLQRERERALVQIPFVHSFTSESTRLLLP